MLKLKTGEIQEIGGVKVLMVGCGTLNEGGKLMQTAELELIETEQSEVTIEDPATAFAELGLSKTIISKLIAASQVEGQSQFASPVQLRDWVDAGNDISDAIDGIGDVSEKQILKALAKLPVSDQ